MNQGGRIEYGNDEFGNYEIYYDSNNRIICCKYDDGSRTDYEYYDDYSVAKEYNSSGIKINETTERKLGHDKTVNFIYYNDYGEISRVSDSVYHDNILTKISIMNYEDGYSSEEKYRYDNQNKIEESTKIVRPIHDGIVDMNNSEETYIYYGDGYQESHVLTIRNNEVVDEKTIYNNYIERVTKEETINYVKRHNMNLRLNEDNELVGDDGVSEINYNGTLTYSTGKKLKYNYMVLDGWQDGKHFYSKIDGYSLFENIDGSTEKLIRNDKGQIVKRVLTYPDNSQKIVFYDFDENGYIKESRIEAYARDGSKINATQTSFNHIEYDEETYDILMHNLLEITENEMIDKYNKDFGDIDELMANLPDKYSGGKLSTSKENFTKYFDDIKELQKNINYSILSYQVCDNELLDSCNQLIDNLFEDDETSLAKVFKNNINKVVEDKDLDGIKEYKENTEYQKLYQNLIPAYKSVDENGNIWYFNKNKNLISGEGNDLKINFGGETFDVSFADGIIKLTDSEGNPLNIFGDYNIDSLQYGGNQGNFREYRYSLLEDDTINDVLELYDPNSTPEEKSAFLEGVANSSCGKVALTNLVFKSFEGKEKDFYDTFGYSMYNIKMNDDGTVGIVDYNYEPLILELSLSNYSKDSYSSIIIDNNMNAGMPLGSVLENGTTQDDLMMMKQYLASRYGISNDDYSTDVTYFSDDRYNIYELNGDAFYLNGKSHAMIKIDEIDENNLIVSSWGRKLICETNNPYYYDENN